MSEIIQQAPPDDAQKRSEKPWIGLAENAIANAGQWMSVGVPDGVQAASVYGQIYMAVGRRLAEVRVVDGRAYVRTTETLR